MADTAASIRFNAWYQKVGISAGKKLDRYLSSGSPRRKYAIEVMLGLPGLFLIHNWYQLSLYSEYRVLQLVCFILRYLGSFVLLGMLGLKTPQTILAYIELYCVLVIGWMLDVCYWMFQNEADGVCRHDTLLYVGDAYGLWWIPSLLTLTVFSVYTWHMLQTFRDESGIRITLFVFTIPLLAGHVICSTRILIYYIAPIYYWLSKINFALASLAHVLHRTGREENMRAGSTPNVQNQFQVQVHFPGKSYMRDVLTIFGTLYFVSVVGIDYCYRFGYPYILSSKYLTSFIGDWCINFVIVSALAACLSFISNCAIAFCRFLIMGTTDALDVFNANIGHRVTVATFLFCAEAGILSVDAETRIENMKCIMFLIFLTMVCEVWDMTESHFLLVSNSGESRKITVYARIVLFCAFILTLPTLLTFYVADLLDIDTWLMLNAAGTFLLLVRVFVSLLEFCFIQATWYVHSGQDWLEDVIYYIRVLKTISSAFCTILLSYYRFMAPFFDAWWLYRVGILILNVIGFVYLVLIKEWQAFTARRSHLKNIPDATTNEISEYNDICSICYANVSSGKRLPCSHIFHTNCLRKWLQIQMVCPLCKRGAVANQ